MKNLIPISSPSLAALFTPAKRENEEAVRHERERADREYRERANRDAAADLCSATDLKFAQGLAVIEAISKGRVMNVYIKY